MFFCVFFVFFAKIGVVLEGFRLVHLGVAELVDVVVGIDYFDIRLDSLFV